MRRIHSDAGDVLCARLPRRCIGLGITTADDGASEDEQAA